MPQPLTVMSTSFTNFINLSGLSALSGSQPIHLRVVGFILINPAANNTPVMVARSVEALTISRTRFNVRFIPILPPSGSPISIAAVFFGSYFVNCLKKSS